MNVKNAVDGLISMFGTAVVRIIVLECRSTEITQTEKQREKKSKNRKIRTKQELQCNIK